MKACKIAHLYLRNKRVSFQKSVSTLCCLSLFPERFFSQRKLDFNGFLGGGGGTPMLGHYFRQRLLSFHPICLVAHSNVWLGNVPGCLNAGRPVQSAVLWVTRQRAVGWYLLTQLAVRYIAVLALYQACSAVLLGLRTKKDVNFLNTKFYIFSR